MKLYKWMSAPNPRRVEIFVAEKGIDIEIIEASDPANPGQLSAEFCGRYPHRRVRCLSLMTETGSARQRRSAVIWKRFIPTTR